MSRIEQHQPEFADPDFEKKKFKYFYQLGRQVPKAVELYRKFELRERRPADPGSAKKGEPIHDAPQHCLVVAARCEILSQALGLSDALVDDLVLAAAIHDAYKKKEWEHTSQEGHTWESFEVIGEQEKKDLLAEGVPEHIIELAQGAGHPINEVQTLLDKENLTEREWAFLILFYVDAYTKGNAWVGPGDAIDERFGDDAGKYTGFSQSAIQHIKQPAFEGETGFQALNRLAHAVGERIAAQLTIDPAELPRWIDQMIVQEIRNVKLKSDD